KEREEFFSRLAYPAYASANPELAAQLFAALDDPELRKLAAPSVAATLIQYDRHAAALEVLASLDEKNRAETAKMIGKHWALRDPNEAVTWLNQLEGAEFDAALGGMFEHLPATTMRGALSDFGKDQLAPSQEMAILRGLSRTTSWTDVKTAAELIPDFYAARGYAPLAAPVPTDWEGTEAQRTRALQFDVAARTVWSLAQKQDVKAALAWTERVPWATPDDKLIAQAYALPETVEIYQRNSVLGPIRPWIDAQLADPAKRRTLEARISAGR
ncbi:MAG: hypothetical protein H7067_07785, partial [Burkholderiales bacterium]|nr:hypothetical protein [Opitutaceae bacterium]